MKALVLSAALLAVVLCACGGAPNTAASGFDNRSSIPDSVLQSWWNQAQTSQFVANAMGEPDTHQYLLADPRALDQSPNGAIYQQVPHAAGESAFDCGAYGSTTVSACMGLTVFTRPETIDITDGVGDDCSNGSTLQQTSVYEMQNVIYHRLGYDMSHR